MDALCRRPCKSSVRRFCFCPKKILVFGLFLLFISELISRGNNYVVRGYLEVRA